MDWLAVFVIVAVVGQLCLPLIGAYNNNRALARAKRRADLLEAAADRQACSATQSAVQGQDVTKETRHD